jgi:hypothetical protein
MARGIEVHNRQIEFYNHENHERHENKIVFVPFVFFVVGNRRGGRSTASSSSAEGSELVQGNGYFVGGLVRAFASAFA